MKSFVVDKLASDGAVARDDMWTPTKVTSRKAAWRSSNTLSLPHAFDLLHKIS